MEVVHTPKSVETEYGAYCDRMFFELEEQVQLFISGPSGSVRIYIEKARGDYEFEIIGSFDLAIQPQRTDNDPAVRGCGWELNHSVRLDSRFHQGYYRIRIEGSVFQFLPVTFIIGNSNSNAEVIVLAPVTTWTAYNEWGGKSVYKNYLENKDVYELSTQRPNDALTYHGQENTHDMPVEINIFRWFEEHFSTNLLPDYYLELHPELFDKAKVIVLAYHAEYFSRVMYENLREVVNAKKSLIGLGANQIYWKVRWKDDFTSLSCRKNMTFFSNPLEMGGRWAYSTNPEGAFLGSRFTNTGMSTYAPYRVTDPAHWLFKGITVKQGQLFGERGINALPICGDETDKRSLFADNTEVIAKGLNPKQSECAYDKYDGSARWDGKGGGELTLTMKSETHAILNTGAIQSGAGLGNDPVFTQVIQNFVERFLG